MHKNHTLWIALALALGITACSNKKMVEEAPADSSAPMQDSEEKALDMVVVTGSRIDSNDHNAERDRLNEAIPMQSGAAAPAKDGTVAAQSNRPVPSQTAPAPAPTAPPESPQVGQIAGTNTAKVGAEMKQERRADIVLTEPAPSAERYAERVDNRSIDTQLEPISTFSVDVDTGSYTNVRRMLRSGQVPPANAVRTEEFLNYFDYGYAPPSNPSTPFSLHSELSAAPWNSDKQLLLIGLKGYEVPKASLPSSHLVFLVDVSGSMQERNKLPLAKEAMRLLAAQMRSTDYVSMVVYAGAAGMVLPPTSGSNKALILRAIDSLEAGGSTNGGDGIYLAYRLAETATIKTAVRRVLLLTDGDFNVGVSGVDDLKRLVENKRESGIALSTVGFGTGNYNDEMAEQLADVGNGSHAYIDTVAEAERLFVSELSASMLTIAQDVKLQLVFDSKVVQSYRLLGYENRLLAKEDFDNDRIDAGEIGAGHSVTALYELTLTPAGLAAQNAARGNLAEMKIRYKAPGGQTSKLLRLPVRAATRQGPALLLAAGVAGFAEKLRGSEAVAGLDYASFAGMVRSARGSDQFREELIELISIAGRADPGLRISQ